MIFSKRRKLSKKVCLLFMLILIFNLVGCSVRKKQDENKIVANDDGYYKRVIVELPEGEMATNISESKEGGINVVTINDNGATSLWHMGEKGNWKKIIDLNSMFNIDNKAENKVFVSPEREMIAECNNDGKTKYYYVNNSGEKVELKLQLRELRDDAACDHDEQEHNHEDEINKIYDVKFINDAIYIIDWNSDIYEVKKDNFSIKLVFDGSQVEDVNSFYVCDRTLILWENEGVYYEGIDSHDKEESMSDRFMSFFNNAKQENAHIETLISNDEMWTLSGDKIGKYNLSDNNFQISKAIGYQITETVESIAVDKGEVLAVVSKYGEHGTKLYKYVKENRIQSDSEETESNSNKLKIWTLEESATFQIAVKCFTDIYPDIEVEIEVGMSDSESGITENDAIKKLNAMIMAGGGPDIIYMDGLSYENYVKSGMLNEMTEYAQNIKATGDYFNNIVDSFSVEGKIYMIPSSVALIGKVGKRECLNASEKMSDFIEYIQANNKEHSVIPSELVNVYILDMYYRDIKDSIIGGEINRKQLEEFFESSKQLCDIAGDKESSLNPIFLYFSPNYAAGYDGTYEFVIGNRVDIASSWNSYDEMAKQIGGSVELPANDYSDRYLVRDCVAVSKASGNKELAMKYIEVALSEECQSEINGTAAFPINKKSLRECNTTLYKMFKMGPEYTESTNTDSFSDIDLDDFDNRISELIARIEEVRKPIQIDMVLDTFVFDAMNSYIHGQVDKDKAIDDLIKKINIYIEE